MRDALVRAQHRSSKHGYWCINTLLLTTALCFGFTLGVLFSHTRPDLTDDACSRDAASSAHPHAHPQTLTNRTPPRPPPFLNPTAAANASSADLPYVQSLDAEWQRHWLRPSNASLYHSIADAECLPFHETEERKRCVLPRTNVELVTEAHIAYSVCGEGVREVALTSVKSFMLHRHSSVTLHVWLLLQPFRAQRQWITQTLSRWEVEHQPHPINNASSSVFLHFVDLDSAMSTNSSVLQRAQKYIGLFRQCASVRLWLPQLLPESVPLVLYVDCDTLVLRDWRQMLAHAQLYSPTQLISFAYEGTSKQCGSYYFLNQLPQPRPQPYAINSGVMLLNLTRARSAAEREYTGRLLRVLEGKHGFSMGDQDAYNLWIGQTQRDGLDLFFPLPLSFNWRECTFLEPGQDGGMTLMHGNAYKFHNANDEPFWAATYQSYFLWQRMPSNPTMAIKV